MALLDSILNTVNTLSKGADSKQQALLLITNLIQQAGGLDALMAKFKAANLGDLVASWLKGDSQQALDSNQLNSALGSQLIDTVASKVGIDSSVATQLLAQYLPDAIAKLGANQSEGNNSPLDIGNISNILGKFLK